MVPLFRTWLRNDTRNVSFRRDKGAGRYYVEHKHDLKPTHEVKVPVYVIHHMPLQLISFFSSMDGHKYEKDYKLIYSTTEHHNIPVLPSSLGYGVGSSLFILIHLYTSSIIECGEYLSN